MDGLAFIVSKLKKKIASYSSGRCVQRVYHDLDSNLVKDGFAGSAQCCGLVIIMISEQRHHHCRTNIY
ncbi:MAG: hypothetical protein ACTSUE_25470 [Promethearchaeota archaeon]